MGVFRDQLAKSRLFQVPRKGCPVLPPNLYSHDPSESPVQYTDTELYSEGFLLSTAKSLDYRA